MLRIYIAGRFEAQERLRAERAALEALGHLVASSWLDERIGELAPARAARRDIRDLHSSNTIILDTIDEDDRGGREVEWGYMLKLTEDWGIRLIIVGPKRNIFHELADQHFGTWTECLQFLKEKK